PPPRAPSVCDLNSADSGAGGKKLAGFSTLRRYVNVMLYGYLENGSRMGILEYQAYLRILNCLITIFLVPEDERRVLVKDVQPNSRAYEVMRLVQENFSEQITLAGLAKQFYVSEAHLSRELKRSLGISFREYLNRVRCEHAETDLSRTSKSIARIALDNGFSSIAMFDKTFVDIYGATPSAYRKNTKKQMEANLERRRALEEKTAAELKTVIFGEAAKARTAASHASADVSHFEPYEKIWSKVINIGNALDLLNPKIQAHVRHVKNALGIQMARFWGVWDKDMMIFPHDGLDGLNFSKLDDCLHFLLSNDIRPFIQVGPIATKSIGAEVYSSVVHKFDTPVIKFSADKWGILIDELMRHLVSRFGEREVKRWRFEMWSPGPWDLDWYHWYTEEHFAAFFHSIKRHVPAAKVGGCEFFRHEHAGKLGASAAFWKARGAVPDFLSYSGFPYASAEQYLLDWVTSRDFLSENIRNIKAEMCESGLADIPLYITSWNVTMSNRNLFNDTVFKGAYIIKNVIDAIGNVDLLTYFVASDAYSEYYDSQRLLYGGCGLMSKDGIAKPAMHAFAFLDKLCDNLVAKGGNYIITRDAEGQVVIAYHNMKAFNYLLGRREVTYNNLNIFFEDTEPLHLVIGLTHMPAGEYKLRRRSVHAKSGSLLDEWLRYGDNAEIWQEEIRCLAGIVTPRTTIKKNTVTDGTLKLGLTVKANEFGIIEVFR
ncbi:MAG: helix-turn-helix domain-containing protein, partial [Clostridiales bacterium]|nr:helix-turn-helix domain-containing protein [Clostridiales bacterium]